MLENVPSYEVFASGGRSVNPFSTAVPFWGQTSQFSSVLSPKRDCGPKGAKFSTSSRTDQDRSPVLGGNYLDFLLVCPPSGTAVLTRVCPL